MSIKITLVDGVVGGFAPASPSSQINLIVKKNDSVNVKNYIRKDIVADQFRLLETPPTFSSKEISAFATDIVSMFKDLPTEQPPGSSDIYGFNISINIDAPGFRWENRPNDGCVISESSIQPSEEQKKKFFEAAMKLKEIANTHAHIVIDN
ncbi:hypothetical protein HK096_008019 [Nowakowskiella sp. JEL0078]|nr:hypothetical protein HK096_008019 [Nowakowskiella sp. JEL0078]